MQRLEVALGDRSYPIYIGHSLLASKDLLREHIRGKQVLLVSNTTVAPLLLKRFCQMVNRLKTGSI